MQSPKAHHHATERERSEIMDASILVQEWARPFAGDDVAPTEVAAYLEAVPWDVDVWHGYAQQLEWAQRGDDALEAYGQAIMIAHRYHPVIHFDHSAITLLYAKLLYLDGAQEEADQQLRAAIFQDHDNLPAKQLLEDGCDRLADLAAYESAIALETDRQCAYQRASVMQGVLRPDYQRHDALVRLWQAGEQADAYAQLQRLSDADAVPALWSLHMAEWAYALGDYKLAMRWVRSALEVHQAVHQRYHRGAALHYLHRSMLHAQMGEPELATMDAVRASEIDVTMTEAKEHLAALRGG